LQAKNQITMEDKKGITELINGIKSKNAEIILSTIKEIRKEGSIAIIPELLLLLNTTDNEEIKKSITNLLYDLKDKKAVPHIIKAINNKKYSNILHTLISSCWESGLDYSKYLNIFIDLCLTSEYLIALEAFTVIENMQEIADEDEKIIALKKLKENIILEKNNEKRTLLNELIQVLPARTSLEPTNS
jgi:HEAT repeat protein